MSCFTVTACNRLAFRTTPRHVLSISNALLGSAYDICSTVILVLLKKRFFYGRLQVLE